MDSAKAGCAVTNTLRKKHKAAVLSKAAHRDYYDRPHPAQSSGASEEPPFSGTSAAFPRRCRKGPWRLRLQKHPSASPGSVVSGCRVESAPTHGNARCWNSQIQRSCLVPRAGQMPHQPCSAVPVPSLGRSNPVQRTSSEIPWAIPTVLHRRPK